MENSILKSTKKALGIGPDYDAFDPDIIMHINTALSTLVQIGIGPVNGFMVEDDTAVWTDFLGTDLNLNPARSLVWMKTRLAFDPPATSFAIAAIKEQIEEIQVRLSYHRESIMWADPIARPPSDDDPFEEVVIDGGVIH